MIANLSGFNLAGLICLSLGIGAVPNVGSEPEREGPVIEYIFQQDLNRKVGIAFPGNIIYVGKLDANGIFLKDDRIGPIPHPDRSGKVLPGALLTWLRFVTIINEPIGPVYEYRSGKLIKGVLNAGGNFLPDAGSKLLPFKGYPYGQAALPIYNLPGRFVPRDGGGKKQAP